MEKQIAYKEIRRKQDAISNFIGIGGRYMIYNGDKLVYKTPAGLENPYSPSSAGRQN